MSVDRELAIEEMALDLFKLVRDGHLLWVTLKEKFADLTLQEVPEIIGKLSQLAAGHHVGHEMAFIAMLVSQEIDPTSLIRLSA